LAFSREQGWWRPGMQCEAGRTPQRIDIGHLGLTSPVFMLDPTVREISCWNSYACIWLFAGSCPMLRYRIYWNWVPCFGPDGPSDFAVGNAGCRSCDGEWAGGVWD
jgi:hypothetical protein